MLIINNRITIISITFISNLVSPCGGTGRRELGYVSGFMAIAAPYFKTTYTGPGDKRERLAGPCRVAIGFLLCSFTDVADGMMMVNILFPML